MSLEAPSTTDPFVAGISRYIGGPWGRYARPRRSWWTPVRILLALTILTSLLGFMQKSSCVRHGWINDYQYTRVCYTDVYVLYTAEQLDGSAHPGDRVGVPYRDHPVEYPAVIGELMWVGAEVTHLLHPNDPRLVNGSTVDDRARTFFDVTVLLLAAFALISTWALARMLGNQRVWDGALFAAAPIIVFDGFVNWDLAAVALTCLGLWAWSRRHPVAAGAALGVGVATKLYPALVLLALGALCLRSARMRSWWLAVAGAVGGFCLAYVPVWLLTKPFPFPNAQCDTHHPLSAWLFFYKFSQIRGADWGSPWLAAQDISGTPLDGNVPCGHAPALLNLGVMLATLFVVSAVALLTMVAPRRPRVGQVTFLLVAGFILVNKVDSPQYCLWLLPFAVLALPRWGPLLTWQATEIVLTAANFYALAHQDRPATGLPTWPYLMSMFVRDAVLLWLIALVVRQMWRPERDVLRAGGADDPVGGPLDAAPDRWTVARGLTATPVPQAP